jgi:hypothetical protein
MTIFDKLNFLLEDKTPFKLHIQLIDDTKYDNFPLTEVLQDALLSDRGLVIMKSAILTMVLFTE